MEKLTSLKHHSEKAKTICPMIIITHNMPRRITIFFQRNKIPHMVVYKQDQVVCSLTPTTSTFLKMMLQEKQEFYIKALIFTIYRWP